MLQGSGSQSLLSLGLSDAGLVGRVCRAGTDSGGGHRGPEKQQPEGKQKNQADGGPEDSSYRKSQTPAPWGCQALTQAGAGVLVKG